MFLPLIVVDVSAGGTAARTCRVLQRDGSRLVSTLKLLLLRFSSSSYVAAAPAHAKRMKTEMAATTSSASTLPLNV